MGTTPALKDPSAIAQFDSSTQGVLLPRLTTTEMNAIIAPAEGLEIYNSTTKTKWYFNATVWVNTVIGRTAATKLFLYHHYK